MLFDLFIFNSSRMSYATFIFHLCFLFNINIRVVNGDVGKSFDFFIADCGHDDPSKHIQAGYYWPASETPFKWRFAGGPIVARNCMLVELCCRKGVTIRSILTQIYVLLVLFTDFHFHLVKFISKHCKYIFFYQNFVHLGETTSKYYIRIIVGHVHVTVFSKVHPACHNIANGIKPGSDSK